MNQSRLSCLLRLPAAAAESELDISRLPHDLRSRRPWTPADSGASLNKHCLRGANSGPSPKARSGPGRQQVHSPTTSIAGPPPNPNDLSGQSCRHGRPVLPAIGGRRVPSPPEPPSTLFSVPAVEDTCESRPKPAKPDHRVAATIAAHVYPTQHRKLQTYD